MKHFLPFSEEQLSSSGSECDRLVPYQVGMSCLEWYIIEPGEDCRDLRSNNKQASNDD